MTSLHVKHQLTTVVITVLLAMTSRHHAVFAEYSNETTGIAGKTVLLRKTSDRTCSLAETETVNQNVNSVHRQTGNLKCITLLTAQWQVATRL